MPQLIIRPTDVMFLEKICYDTARRRIDRVRTHLNKFARAPITVIEYCRFYQFDDAEVHLLLQKAEDKAAGKL